MESLIVVDRYVELELYNTVILVHTGTVLQTSEFSILFLYMYMHDSMYVLQYM